MAAIVTNNTMSKVFSYHVKNGLWQLPYAERT